MSIFVRTFECSGCEGLFEIEHLDVNRPSWSSVERDCPACKGPQTLKRLINGAPHLTVGMYVRRYNGDRLAEVRGSGSYLTDYKDSDLVAGRAQEIVEQRAGFSVERDIAVRLPGDLPG